MTFLPLLNVGFHTCPHTPNNKETIMNLITYKTNY